MYGGDIMKYQFGYLNEEYDERLEKLQLDYIDLYHKSMSEYDKKDWKRYEEFNNKENELIKIIIQERRARDKVALINTKKSKKKK